MIPAHITEALANASQTLRTCRPKQRDAILNWINALLDRAARATATKND